jgi:hypothetical protein
VYRIRPPSKVAEFYTCGQSVNSLFLRCLWAKLNREPVKRKREGREPEMREVREEQRHGRPNRNLKGRVRLPR